MSARNSCCARSFSASSRASFTMCHRSYRGAWRASSKAFSRPAQDDWPPWAGVLQRRARATCAALRGSVMAFPVRACALVGRFADPQVAEPLSVLVPHLAARKITVLVSADTPLPQGMPEVVRLPTQELAARADLLIAIGGDGTLLYAAGLVARHGVPLLGVNRGRLGFLTDVMPQNLFPCI